MRKTPLLIDKYTDHRFLSFSIILSNFENHLIKRGNYVKTQKNLYYLFKYFKQKSKFQITFQEFLIVSIINLMPFLELYSIKRGRRKIKVTRVISKYRGLRICLKWLHNHFFEKNSLKFILKIYSELADSYYQRGHIYNKKLTYYKECVNTRFRLR